MKRQLCGWPSSAAWIVARLARLRTPFAGEVPLLAGDDEVADRHVLGIRAVAGELSVVFAGA
jgi:hypothetical protein